MEEGSWPRIDPLTFSVDPVMPGCQFYADKGDSGSWWRYSLD